MGRRHRIDIEGGIHHVMNRGVDRQAIFFADQDRIEFGRRLADIHQRFGVETLAYCLMGNHYHLLLRTPVGGLSEAMHRLGALYTRHTNDRIGRDGPLFRSRFHSIHVATAAYLLTATRYIHRNALDVAGVRTIEHYRWSSYRAYIGLRPVPTFMRTEIVLDAFGGTPTELANFHNGEEPFANVSTLTRSATDLAQLVDLVIAHDDLHKGDDRSSSPWRHRTLLLLMLANVGDAPWRSEVESSFGFGSPSARRMAIHRARRRRETDPAIDRAASLLERLLTVQDRAA